LQKPQSPQMQEALAAKTVADIVSKIHSCSESLDEAKRAAAEAESMKPGGFLGGRTRKKTNLLATVTTKITETMDEMNGLVNESIKYTSVSTALAAIMCAQFQTVLDDGFTDTDKRLQRLNETGKKTLEEVIRRAQEQNEQLSKIDKNIKISKKMLAKSPRTGKASRGTPAKLVRIGNT